MVKLPIAFGIESERSLKTQTIVSNGNVRKLNRMSTRSLSTSAKNYLVSLSVYHNSKGNLISSVIAIEQIAVNIRELQVYEELDATKTAKCGH